MNLEIDDFTKDANSRRRKGFLLFFFFLCHFMQDENWKNFCQNFSKRVLQMGQNYFPTRRNNCGGGQCTSTSTKSSWLHNLQRHLQLLGELFQHLVNSKNWYDKKFSEDVLYLFLWDLPLKQIVQWFRIVYAEL